MATLLSDTNGTRDWPVINNIVEGSDVSTNISPDNLIPPLAIH